ncbi:cytochrome P450 [Archangium primigenium]|uniref:cytochrome P450 n=1 Tax=[Archangium] primigenium TaxID=2792470 RepID=UPI001959DF1E|nr:cytochrome P450 [Archangium primigenium]MBM7115656.1 cytochrome P450 [Archangium primigenium]
MDLLSRFDFFNPEVTRDPYPYFAELRDKAPLHYDAKLRAHVLSRHEDVSFVLKNHALFSSTQIRIAGKLQEERSAVKELGSVSSLIATDPPVHTRMRGLVSRSFTPKQINALAPRVRELSRQLVTEMTARGEFDFMDALASPLPVTIIAEMLGIEPARRRDFKRWSDTLVQSGTDSLKSGQASDAVVQSGREMLAYMTEVAEARRREPRGDLISLLVQESDGVAALSPQEVNSFATLLLIAGNETTTNLLGNAITALIRHPEAYEALRRDPSSAACAAICEETLRYDSPVIALFRRTTQEVELSGGKLPADAAVMVLLASANHDPRKFPEPERFDPKRDTNGLMSFGHGVHFCLGAPLSRLEAPVALQELMEQAPRLRFAPRQPETIDYGHSFFLRGPKALWLQKH